MAYYRGLVERSTGYVLQGDEESGEGEEEDDEDVIEDEDEDEAEDDIEESSDEMAWSGSGW